jgi:CHAT domain-containing protein
MLIWKGAVSARQQLMHRLRRHAEGKPGETARLLDELQRDSRELANLSSSSAAAGQEQKRSARLTELSDAVERLEQALAADNPRFHDELAQRRRTANDVRRAMPHDAALVDMIEYSHFSPGVSNWKIPIWEQRLAAFVVRPDAPVARIELGAVAPISAAIETWRRTFGAAGRGADAGIELRKQVWNKIEPVLGGATTILMSPDGAAARFPWPALPGAKSGEYLIDERSIVVTPIPSLLPQLLAKPAIHASGPAPALLLVGDVDFGAEPGMTELATAEHPVARGGAPVKWPSLPGTRDEVAAIQSTYQRSFTAARPVLLTGAAATKSAVCKGAERCQFLHLSTHGFFAPAELRSALSNDLQRFRSDSDDVFGLRSLAGFHPGLLSGVVLAGANRPFAADKEDGVLSALEVAELDLDDVQLATLSACETGLGETAGGEGLLGLQRAFQTAGAKTVVAGLWKVPDRATQSLMVRFYENLWSKKLSKLEALREAQRWLLHDGRRAPELARGLQFLPQPDSPDANGLPPFYWAAFVLSGDWR